MLCFPGNGKCSVSASLSSTMEDVLKRADEIIANMTENLQDLAHLGSNDAQNDGHQGAQHNNFRWTQAEINANYEVDVNVVRETCHAPKGCTNKNRMPQTCEAPREYAYKKLPQTCDPLPTTDQPMKTRSSSDYTDLNKLADLVAEKLKKKTTLNSPRTPELTPERGMRQTPSDSRR